MEYFCIFFSPSVYLNHLTLRATILVIPALNCDFFRTCRVLDSGQTEGLVHFASYASWGSLEESRCADEIAGTGIEISAVFILHCLLRQYKSVANLVHMLHHVDFQARSTQLQMNKALRVWIFRSAERSCEALTPQNLVGCQRSDAFRDRDCYQQSLPQALPKVPKVKPKALKRNRVLLKRLIVLMSANVSLSHFGILDFQVRLFFGGKALRRSGASKLTNHGRASTHPLEQVLAASDEISKAKESQRESKGFAALKHFCNSYLFRGTRNHLFPNNKRDTCSDTLRFTLDKEMLTLSSPSVIPPGMSHSLDRIVTYNIILYIQFIDFLLCLIFETCRRVSGFSDYMLWCSFARAGLCVKPYRPPASLNWNANKIELGTRLYNVQPWFALDSWQGVEDQGRCYTTLTLIEKFEKYILMIGAPIHAVQTNR